MTSQEIALIKTSLAKVAPIADQVSAIFYARLFELDPTLRELFHGDMREQGRKLMTMLGVAVNSLERLEQLVPAVRQLGLQNSSQRVREEHYETVGDALLWTLAKGLGREFTLDTRIAWGKTYWLLAETMKAGARDGAAKAARAVA